MGIVERLLAVKLKTDMPIARLIGAEKGDRMMLVSAGKIGLARARVSGRRKPKDAAVMMLHLIDFHDAQSEKPEFQDLD